jgi:hypothetical protein
MDVKGNLAVERRILNGKLREGCEETTSTLGNYSRQSSLLIVFPVVKSILGAIQTNLSDAPQISKASCLDIAIPGIFGVPIEEIITHCILLSMQEKEEER